MKHRVSVLALALCLLLATPALAAGQPDRVKTYSGQFSDLSADSVFYENVTALYEYGLSVGKTDGTFGLRDPVTVGQLFIFAGRVRSLWLNGDPESGAASYRAEGQRAWEPYQLYLQAEGVFGTELDGLCTSAATRAQVAHVLASALPEDALPPINDDLVTQGYAARRYITDVTEYTPYYQDILFLYRAGISQGSGDDGAFEPQQPITRGALAAMLTRMVDPALRITLSWTVEPETPSAAGTTLSSLIPAGTYIAAPATAEEMDESIRYMLSSGQSTLTLQYDSLTPVTARQAMEQALSTVKTYCEQCYNTVSCTYGADGSLRLTFSAANSGGNLSSYREETMAAAIAVHDQLWADGLLTAGMTEREKAWVYYTWICDNCTYDYGASDSSLSHIPYSLFTRGTAVCDGYTGAYNLLLKLEGIQCTALANDEHIWTVAVLDGTQVHIDTTWADSGSTIDYTFFAMTPSQSWNQHSW